MTEATENIDTSGFNNYLSIHDYLSIDDFVARYPQFKKSSIRYYLLHREENGFANVVTKVGRKIFIHEPSFGEWLKGKLGDA